MEDKKKKETKTKVQKNGSAETTGPASIGSRADLKTFLMSIRDRMSDETAAPIFALGAMNHILASGNVYELMDNENKEIARDIWLRLRQQGLQLRNPPLLFSAEE